MHQRLANTMGRPEGRVTLQGKGGEAGAPSYDDIAPAGATKTQFDGALKYPGPPLLFLLLLVLVLVLVKPCQ